MNESIKSVFHLVIFQVILYQHLLFQLYLITKKISLIIIVNDNNIGWNDKRYVWNSGTLVIATPVAGK